MDILEKRLDTLNLALVKVKQEEADLTEKMKRTLIKMNELLERDIIRQDAIFQQIILKQHRQK